MGCGRQTETRRDSRGQGQADFSAEQPAPRACARLPAADADPGRPGDRVEPADQGSPQADCVIRRRGSSAVLPARYRMTRSTEFGATVSQGVRAVQPDLVVHTIARCGRRRWPPDRSGRLEIRRHCRTTAPGRPSAASCGPHGDRRPGSRRPRRDPRVAWQPLRDLGTTRTRTADGVAPCAGRRVGRLDEGRSVARRAA